MSEPKRQLFPLVVADAALFCVEDGRLKVLLVQRSVAPERGRWALPGGILRPGEDGSLEDTARRILKDKTGVRVPYLEQVATFSGPDRDPRGWSVCTLFYALVERERLPVPAQSGTELTDWCDAVGLTRRLAFDHARLLAAALARLKERVGGDKAPARNANPHSPHRARGPVAVQTALPLHLMPEKFTLTQLQRTIEAILDGPIDKGAFRRRLKEAEAGAIVAVPGEFIRGAQRPAQLYRAARGAVFR